MCLPVPFDSLAHGLVVRSQDGRQDSRVRRRASRASTAWDPALLSQHRAVRGVMDTRTGIPIKGAMCVQRLDDSEFCNSHYVSHFAAFFIVTGAKTSLAEGCYSC